MKEQFKQVLDELCNEKSYEDMAHFAVHDVPMPSTKRVSLIMQLLKSIYFPGYYGNTDLKSYSMRAYIGSYLDEAIVLLTEQIKRGLCFVCEKPIDIHCSVCEEQSKDIACQFMQKIPYIRKQLAQDVRAAFDGDPAAQSYSEAIFCYPGILALAHYRTAHELFQLNVPLLPRMICELAHAETGIDIHPQAQIGHRFFMDHGTGIVIGGTCIIGDNVKLYQGVTLGAKSFPLDDNGRPIKGIPRHPILEDNVVVYSGASILGRVTIGANSVIGGNAWILDDVPRDSKIFYNQK